MSVSFRKISAVLQLKLRLIVSNMSIIFTPVFAIIFVIVMGNLMPQVDTNETAMPFSTEGFLLSFGLIFNIAIAGISMSSSPIAEEKEKHTLRVLMTSSVRGPEYFIGSMIPILVILVATNILLVPASGVSLGDIPLFTYLVITTLATLISIVIGYIIGVFAKNQAQATLVSTPILVLFTSTPVLKVFNETFAEVLNYTYSGVLANLAETLSSSTEYQWNITDTSVLLAWLVLTLGIFMYVYKKNGLDSE
ncbi:ABC transporter permease subunit [Marinococcus sp. PL1-022]|uniref:ABC transporter permease subunit n=1 Tax=Marinococcus sp. PL1-022 TaxID=3095363 RepID=UPI0029C3110D|nr:ABC transporter permease subunit [Marinococcus sp. PL1-022]MDX6152613.1 ABC transporter permease [Marinococcus sp. PL1-022]